MKALKDVLTQDDAVIFVGSGISQWSGLPSWWGLISQLSDYLDNAGIDSSLVRTEAEDGDLLQAASYGFAKLTKPQIADFVRRAVQLGRAMPVEIHRRIVTLGPTCFITTNYDDLLEQALASWAQGQSFRNAVFPAYSIAKHYVGADPLPLYQVDDDYLSALVGRIRQGDEWATELAKTLCTLDRSVADLVGKLAQKKKGILRGILNYCVSGNDEEIFSALEKMVEVFSSRVSTKTLSAVLVALREWRL